MAALQKLDLQGKKWSYMFGHECEQILSFKTLASKKGIYACLETEIGKIFFLEKYTKILFVVQNF